MTGIESWVFSYFLNSLWQAVFVFSAAWIAAQMARKAGPRMEHRVWVIALLLQVLLPFCHFHLNGLRTWFFSIFGSGASAGPTRVILGPGTSPQTSMLRVSSAAITIIAAAYVCILFYLAGRLLWAFWRTEAMRRTAVNVVLDNSIRQKLDRCCGFFNIDSSTIQIAVSPAIPGPVTAGIRRNTLLLPPDFLTTVGTADLDTIFAHEFAHIHRRDFAKNLLYGLISLPVAYHPLTWLTRSHIAETRELVCDAMAAKFASGRDTYARSLLRLAALQLGHVPAPTLHAIGIFDTNILERRIMTLTQKHLEARSPIRLAITVACGVIALMTCASALAFRLDVGTQGKQPEKVTVSSALMEKNLIYKVQPVYPSVAKKAKVEGSVVLAAVIGKNGLPKSLRVESGPPLLTQSAMDAVKEWRWKPFLLNGEPVEVETTITVVYTLKK
jgi:TonB family protein